MKSFELIDMLGLCEHCGSLVSMSDYAGDESMNARWICRCGKELTHKSFGYDQGGAGAKRVLWIGSNQKWRADKPNEEFKIGDLRVVMSLPFLM